MNSLKKYSGIFLIFSFVLSLTFCLSSCNNENLTEPSIQSEDQYLTTTAINTAFSSDADDEDNLFAGDVIDFDSEGPVPDNESGFDIPYDSLIKWGRRISEVNTNTNISTSGDTLKTVEINKIISGNFITVGFINGILDTAFKPFTQSQKRLVIFKRIGRRDNPRFNWRVYQFSAIDGNTTTPQNGKENIVINKVEIYKNNDLKLTLNGPDFTGNLFRARFFGNGDSFESETGSQIKFKVYLTSNQSDTDIVSYHWARNSHGYYRERFRLISEMPIGSNFERVYEKEFDIYPQHRHGIHNAFISANTRASLFDNSPLLFSSTYLGFPYKVRQ